MMANEAPGRRVSSSAPPSSARPTVDPFRPSAAPPAPAATNASPSPAAPIGAVAARLRALPLVAPLRGPSFRLLLGGQALALLADQAFLVALTWLVLALAGPGAALGSVLAVAAIPGVLLLPVGGWLSDRVGAARVIAATSAGRAALLTALAALVLTGRVELWHLYALGGALSAVDALYYPAASAIVPELVDREQLTPANALVQGAEQASGLLGPALAAGAIALVGLGATFGALAVAFAGAAAAFVALLRVRRSVAGVVAGPNASADASAATPAADTVAAPRGDSFAATDRPAGAVGRSDLLAGARFVLGDPLLRAMVAVLAALNVALSGPLLVGGAVLAETRFGGAGAFGTLLAAFGAGSLLGTVGTGLAPRARRRGAAFLLATLLLGVGVALLGLAPSLLVACAVGAAMGGVAGYLGVVLVAWLQERIPDGLRGQVMGVVMFAVVALDPVSYAVVGALSGIDLRALFLGAGALLGLAALGGLASRAVREFD